MGADGVRGIINRSVREDAYPGILSRTIGQKIRFKGEVAEWLKAAAC